MLAMLGPAHGLTPSGVGRRSKWPPGGSHRPTTLTEPRFKEIPPMYSVYLIEADQRDSREALPMIRELYSRHPEILYLEPYELQSILWSLGYCEAMVPEAEIAAAIEVARGDFAPGAGAA
jgi:hypothetical protein